MPFPDLNSLVSSIFMRETTMYGQLRIPFFFGSSKSLGVDLSKVFSNASIPVGSTGELTASSKINEIAQSLSEGSSFSLGKSILGQFEFFRKLIRLRINPNELSIKSYVRQAEVKTGGGRAYYFWLDANDRVSEVYTLSMSGVTGSLLPGSIESDLKLYCWLKLRELTLEPYYIKVKDKDGKDVKVRNYQFILVQTIGLPVLVMFVGFYKTPIMLTERADSQYNISWNFEFVIEQMYPDYATLSQYASIRFLVPSLTEKVLGE